jgi:aspartyl-tRNA synthetase
MERTLVLETAQKAGEEVMIQGWVNARRNMGKIVFLDVRDRSGLLQVVCVPADLGEEYEAVKDVRPEWVVEIVGVVNERGAKQQNQEMPTGKVELLAKKIKILGQSETPPFEIDKDTKNVSEELRLKYRYLDLRTERMHKNLVLRHNVNKFFRDYLNDKGFLEIETPILTKGTPEGAREFIIPSRIYPGQFYVLPQAPQQFKQLLMTAGVEKYFQIARCFRDEDQRGDRQPEFTQLDLEMSFVEREDVMSLVEDLMIQLIKKITPEKKIQTAPFPRLSYAEAMKKYGTDKPDLREDKNDPNLLAFCWIVDFPFFEKTEEGGWTFTHNPFSAAMPDYQGKLLQKKDIGKIVAAQYDLALNGYEVGGGSIRNHDHKALEAVLEIIGHSPKQIQEQFGHMLEAFKLGTPPHGGIAPGIDRLLMILANEPNIREVIPFPKTGDARDLMMDAPSELPVAVLSEVHIKVEKKKK